MHTHMHIHMHKALILQLQTLHTLVLYVHILEILTAAHKQENYKKSLRTPTRTYLHAHAS